MSIEYSKPGEKTELAIAREILEPRRKRGRPAGAANLYRNAKAAEVCASLNLDPLRELLKIARRRKTPLDLRVQAYAHTLKYIYPALSTVAVHSKNEVSVDVARTMRVVLERRPELADSLERFAIELALAGEQHAIADTTQEQIPPERQLPAPAAGE